MRKQKVYYDKDIVNFKQTAILHLWKVKDQTEVLGINFIYLVYYLFLSYGTIY